MPPAPLDDKRQRRRLWISVLALPLGLIATDVGYGALVFDAGSYQGPRLPPFDVASTPALVEWVAEQRELPARVLAKQICGLFDPELGWTQREGLKVRDGLQVRIESHGARAARDYGEQPAPGALRLACFGDSFTFGSEVGTADVWSVQLEALDARLEVMNFGVPGYGLDQSLLRYRRLHDELHADVVVIGLQVDGIGRNVNRSRHLLATNSTQLFVKPRFILEEGALRLVPLPFATREELLECAAEGELEQRLAEHEAFPPEYPLIPGSTLLRLWGARQAEVRRDHRRLWSEPEGEAFQVTLALLESFRAEALEHGARAVLLVLFPDRTDHAQRDESGSWYLAPLREALATWDWIDLDRALAEELVDPERLFLRTHFNREGNARVASAVHDWLQEHPRLLEEPGAH